MRSAQPSGPLIVRLICGPTMWPKLGGSLIKLHPRIEKHRICRMFLDGASRARTGDLLRAKQALSQLSYGPFDQRVYAVATWTC